jgi:hypothetical protein
MVDVPAQIRLRADGGAAFLNALAHSRFAGNGDGRTPENLLHANGTSVRVAYAGVKVLLRPRAGRRAAADDELLAHAL